MKQYLIGLSIVFVFFAVFLSSCQNQTDRLTTDIYTGDYVAHLQLDDIIHESMFTFFVDKTHGKKN